MFQFITKWAGQLPGWLEFLQFALGIAKFWYKDLIEFIEYSVEQGMKILDEMKKTGSTPAEIQNKELELRDMLTTDAKAEFSASPPYVRVNTIDLFRSWIVKIYRLKHEDQIEIEQYLRMQAVHPVTIEDVKEQTKKTYPQLWPEG